MRLYTSSFDSTKWGSCRLLLPFSFVIGTHSLTHSLWVADSYAFHTDKALKFCARFVLYFEVHFHKLPALPTLYSKCLCVALDPLSGCCLSRLGSSLGHRTLAFHCLISLCALLCVCCVVNVLLKWQRSFPFLLLCQIVNKALNFSWHEMHE